MTYMSEPRRESRRLTCLYAGELFDAEVYTVPDKYSRAYVLVVDGLPEAVRSELNEIVDAFEAKCRRMMIGREHVQRIDAASRLNANEDAPGLHALARKNAEQITTGCGFPPDAPRHAEGCVEDSPQDGPMVNAAPDPEPDPRPGVAEHLEVHSRRGRHGKRRTPLDHLPRNRTNGTVSTPASELQQPPGVSEAETGIEEEAAPEPPADPLPAGSDAPEPEGDDAPLIEMLGRQIAPEPEPEPEREHSSPCSDMIFARLSILGDMDALIEEQGLKPNRIAWLHRMWGECKAELAKYQPQSVVAAVVAVRDGEAESVVRMRFTPICPPDGLAKPLARFLNAWAVHLEKQTPLQEREEKARLVAMLEVWR